MSVAGAVGAAAASAACCSGVFVSRLLCVQIDAAINPGNSGGPALKGGRVVGVAFQGCDASAAQNVGYIVPWNVVRHLFVDLSRHRRYTGFPAAGVLFQQLENECMQQKLGVSKLKAEDLPKGNNALWTLPLTAPAAGNPGNRPYVEAVYFGIFRGSSKTLSLTLENAIIVAVGAAASAASAGVTASGILVTAADALRSRNFLARAKAAAEKLVEEEVAPEPAPADANSAAPETGAPAKPAAVASAPVRPQEVCGGPETGTSCMEDALPDCGPLADPVVVAREALATVDRTATAAAAAGKPLPSAAERKALVHAMLEQKIGLRPEDVVMAVDGADVAGDGTVHFR